MTKPLFLCWDEDRNFPMLYDFPCYSNQKPLQITEGELTRFRNCIKELEEIKIMLKEVEKRNE